MSAWESYAVAAAAIAVMAAVSLLFAPRFPRDARVPMQWDLRGKPTWTAPVWLAVSFVPALALVILAVFAIAAKDALLPFLAIIFLVIHALHLSLAARHFG